MYGWLLKGLGQDMPLDIPSTAALHTAEEGNGRQEVARLVGCLLLAPPAASAQGEQQHVCLHSCIATDFSPLLLVERFLCFKKLFFFSMNSLPVCSVINNLLKTL